jgi:hypothetical protein
MNVGRWRGISLCQSSIAVSHSVGHIVAAGGSDVVTSYQGKYS